jgi:hypothetical protein
VRPRVGHRGGLAQAKAARASLMTSLQRDLRQQAS